MPKQVKELSALSVSRLSQEGHYAVGGVAGLYLYVAATGARAWVLRVVVGVKRRHMGLGSYPGVSLAEARAKARACRTLIEQGIDPIEERKAVKNRLIAQQQSTKTFEECALAYVAAKQDEWKNAKHRSQWVNTLRTYAFPAIGNRLVSEIELPEVLRVLEPIWKEKTETASRLRGRIESILDWAYSKGLPYRLESCPLEGASGYSIAGTIQDCQNQQP